MINRDDLLQDIFTVMDTQQRVLHGVISEKFSKHGLSPAQLKLIFSLSMSGKSSLKPLAEKLYLTPGALTQLIEPLESSKLLSKQQDDKDRRITYIKLTKRGEKKLAEIKKSRNQFFKEALNELDDNELEVFSRIQHKMFNYFTSHKTN